MNKASKSIITDLPYTQGPYISILVSEGSEVGERDWPTQYNVLTHVPISSSRR